MAVITRIEIVNYLCEGWKSGMGAARWRPLWPANTLRLAGQSTAIQVPNGCGKTSVTSAILFLLSRDRKLKKEFVDRCAPPEKGYTHIRIEFAIRPDEDITQRDLITLDPMDCPAQTYVIGVCCNRGDEDLQFYRHPGMLEDSPAYRVDNSTIIFTSNDEFRSTTKRVRGADWNRWGSVSEWSKVVGEFMSREVVRQNVVFHLSGAGDASATFKKVVPEPGERFDEAYFKQVAAPQLLANLMGESAEEGERAIEDTITISMTRFIDAKLKVERKESYLQRRQAMEAEFAPVLGAADAIQETETSYQRQLQGLGRDAAFLDRFAGSGGSSLPGVPLDPAGLHFSGEIKKCLMGMAVDKDGSVVIADDSLAQLLNQSTGNLNKTAEGASSVRQPVLCAATSAQLIDFERNIKFSEGYGGRRKPTRHYDRLAALELTARRASDGNEDRVEILRAAFDTAEQVIDTNPFRKEYRRLATRQAEVRVLIADAVEAGRSAEERQRSLETQVTQRAENQAAYQEFCAQAFLLPAELQAKPVEAEAWVEKEIATRNDAVVNHSLRVGELSAGWQNLQRLRSELGFQTPAERLSELQAQKDLLESQGETALSKRDNVKTQHEEHLRQRDSAKEEYDAAHGELISLAALTGHDETFRRIFGDVDPLAVSPPIDSLRKFQRDVRKQTAAREPKSNLLAKLTELATANKRFLQLFGDADPRQLRPESDRDKLLEESTSAQLVYSQHLPLAEAFEQHTEIHLIHPEEWILRTDNARVAAERRAQEAGDRSDDLQRELEALEDLSLVSDTEFSNALEALQEAGIPFVRVRDLILECEADESRRLTLLAAFGALLSAPVLDSLAQAEQAMLALNESHLEVPILLREPLLEAFRGNSILVTPSGAAVAFLAGICTRRIRAIVDPLALEEEKQDYQTRLDAEHALQEAAIAETATHSPHTDAYRLATQALQAVQQGSVEKSRNALQVMRDLEPKIERAKQLCSSEALRSIGDANEFLGLGGISALNNLTVEIKALTEAIVDMDKQIAAMELLTSQEAVLAHDGAVKYVRGGGSARIATLQTETNRLLGVHQEQAALVEQLGIVLNEAQNSFDGIAQQTKNFLPGFGSTKRGLEEAISFETDGHSGFMETKDQKATVLTELRDALKPVLKVNFTRAQSYKDHEGEDDAQLQELIGKARNARETSAQTARTLAEEIDRLSGLAHSADRSAETLQELAYILSEKRAAAAPYLKDLAEREGGATPPESHSLFARTEQLRNRLLDWRQHEGPFDRTFLTAMRSEIEEIDIVKAGADARDAKKQSDRAREQFRTLRSAFCMKAVNNDVNALSQAEIEAIQAANTVEDLKELSRLGARLREDLAQEQADLLELQDSAGTVEKESIETLTRLVESCHANLVTLNSVMSRNPNARFFIETKIISGEDIRKLMNDLRDGIEARKRAAQSRTSLDRKNNNDGSIRADVRRALIDSIFTETSVEFRHVGMWSGDKQPIQESFSEGQKAALQMLWLIKESEYHLECAVRSHLGGGSKKKLRSRSQRILFFDGLFSNLTDRTLIDEAFKGLGDTNSNLQLIGLIHNPEYRNNPKIFPSLVIGRRAGWREVEGERSFMRFEDGRSDGSMGLTTFMVRQPKNLSSGDARG